MKNSKQQRLFNHYNPLEERLGTDFFDQLPKKPGIYKMYGGSGQLLYVGKAKNLRNRLFTYRRAKVGKTSRKTIRLVRMVHDIEYELCKNEKQALLRENSLIRQQRPEFNHAKKSPETYYFVHFKQSEGWTFKLNMRQYSENAWHTYGAFKGHVMVRKALGALLRLLYIAEHQVKSVHHLPSVLLKNLTPLHYQFPIPEEGIKMDSTLLENMFTGTSDKLFEDMLSTFKDEELLDKYIGKLLLEDLESLKRFYEKCCLRNHQIATKMDLDNHIIPQQKLDDYLIEIALD